MNYIYNMSRWCTIKLVVAPTEEGGEPTTLETSARVLGRAALFQELLKEGETVIPITNFEANDVALFLDLATMECASADATSELLAGRFTRLLTVEMIERVAPFCDFCGAHELLRKMVSLAQLLASVLHRVASRRCLSRMLRGHAGITVRVVPATFDSAPWSQCLVVAQSPNRAVADGLCSFLGHSDRKRLLTRETLGLRESLDHLYKAQTVLAS